MKPSWWLKMIPYFIVIIWTSVVSFLIINNTTSIDNISEARAKAICIAANQSKSIINTMITKLHDQSDPPDKLVWDSLHQQLGLELIPINCNNITAKGVEK